MRPVLTTADSASGNDAPAHRRGGGTPVIDRAAVKAEQIRGLYRSPVAMYINLVNAPIVTAVLWHERSSARLAVWLAIFLIVVPLRLWLRRRFLGSPRSPGEVDRWATLYVAGIGLTGCLWGALAATVYGSPSPDAQAFVAFVLGGMCAGAVASSSVYPPALAAFILPAVLPPSAVLLAQGTVMTAAMGALGLIFCAALTLMGRHFGRSFAEGFRLQLENAALIADLVGARDAAEAASLAKSRFLANMSHELRTPLNAIIGFSEMMREQLRGPVGAYRDYVAHIHDSGTHLLSLINGILDLSKAQAGRLELVEDSVDLGALLGSCLDLVRPQAARAKIELARLADDGLPIVVADEGKLRQIVLNLLSNAVKFTPAGGVVRIGAGLDPDGDLLVSVEDTGIGMAPDDIPKAMQPFQQLESALNRKFAGTGLGLPLARELTELHGGTLALVSEPGRGTTALVRLPAIRVRAPIVEAVAI